LLCIPARLYFLPKFFEGWELLLLDGEDENIEAWVEAKRARDMGGGDGDNEKTAATMEKTDEVSASSGAV
jgi:hypothetical protein